MHTTNIETLLESIGPALRSNRERVATLIYSNPDLIPNLIYFVFKTNHKLHHKAAWILEILLERDLELLLPHIDFFTKNIEQLTHESAIRPISKICNWIATAYTKGENDIFLKKLSSENCEQIIEAGFDWMIGSHKVATKAYSMTALYHFGLIEKPEYQWIHKELKNIILQQMHASSAAYKARGRMTLELIAKNNTLNN